MKKLYFDGEDLAKMSRRDEQTKRTISLLQHDIISLESQMAFLLRSDPNADEDSKLDLEEYRRRHTIVTQSVLALREELSGSLRLQGRLRQEFLIFKRHGDSANGPIPLVIVSTKWIDRLQLVRFFVPKKLRDTYVVPAVEELKIDYLDSMCECKTPWDRRFAMLMLVGQSAMRLGSLAFHFVTAPIIRFAAGVLGLPVS